MAALAYCLGLTILVCLAITLGAYLLRYLLVLVSIFYIHVKVDNLLPNIGIIRREYRNRKLWKIRFLLILLWKPRITLDLLGVRATNNLFTQDYTHYWPRTTLLGELRNPKP